jgi:hypothetical protein
MIQLPAKGLSALFMACCAVAGVARAADPLPAETRFVAASAAAPPTTQTFNIATATDLVVTLHDQNFPIALASGGVVVTQGGKVAGSATFAAPAPGTPGPNAVASISGAIGAYTLYVFGVPGTGGVGTFSACVAPKASPSNCIQSASLAGTITLPTATNPTVADNVTTLTVTMADTYTFNFADLTFPVALSTAPSLALFQGSQPIIPSGQTTPAIVSGTALPLSPGTYQLFAIAQADPNVMAGLYSVNIVGTSGTPLLSQTFPVGLTSAAPADAALKLPGAQTVTLTVTDYGFPAKLTSASALLTAGGTVVATAISTGGAQTGSAPAGQLQLWTYGNPAAGAGTYSADVSSGATDLYTFAAGVSTGTNFAYAFVVPGDPLPAGAYSATAADLQFPSQLTSLSFAVAENGLILQQSAAAGTVSFNVPASGNVIVLASAQPPGSGSTSANGLFDVNLQSTGATASLVFDRTQNVSSTPSLFDSQSLTIGVDASFDATLTDLKVPAAFDTLALLVSKGSTVLGKIYGGGTFSFPASAGTYLLTFVATPSAMQNFGTYATSVVFSPPVVTLTSSASSVATGGTVTLSWSATNATSCTASGGTFPGSQSTSTSSLAVVVSATTTYSLSCTGAGGTTAQSVTVTATAAKSSSSSGGGGAVDPVWLILGSGLLVARLRRRQSTLRQA